MFSSSSIQLFSFHFFFSQITLDWPFLILKRKAQIRFSLQTSRSVFFSCEKKKTPPNASGARCAIWCERLSRGNRMRRYKHTHTHSLNKMCLSKLTQIMGAFRRSSSKFRDLTSICPVHKSAFMFFCVHFCFPFGQIRIWPACLFMEI